MARLLRNVAGSYYVLRIHPEHVHCIIHKISRRLLKLDKSRNNAWVPVVEKAMTQAADALRAQRALAVKQVNPEIDTSILSTLDFAKDIRMNLPALAKHIKSIKKLSGVNLGGGFDPAAG